MTKTDLPYKTAGDLRSAGDPSHAIDDIKNYAEEVSWPEDQVLWSTTSACVSVPGSSRVRPVTPDYAPRLGTPCLTGYMY